MDPNATETRKLNQLPQLDCPLSASSDLLVRLRQSGDRLGHELVLQSNDSLIDLISSVESVAGNWPDSPPLQEIVAETHGEHTVLLGIGLAGRSHWSSAMQVQAEGRHIAFQIACRAVDPPGWLGSTYLVGKDFRVKTRDEQHAWIESGQMRFEIVVDKARIHFDADTRRLQIVARMDYEKLPATFEWNYSVGIA